MGHACSSPELMQSTGTTRKQAEALLSGAGLGLGIVTAQLYARAYRPIPATGQRCFRPRSGTGTLRVKWCGVRSMASGVTRRLLGDLSCWP